MSRLNEEDDDEGAPRGCAVPLLIPAFLAMKLIESPE